MIRYSMEVDETREHSCSVCSSREINTTGKFYEIRISIQVIRLCEKHAKELLNQLKGKLNEGS